MAELKIKKKKPVWPWVIAILLIIIAVLVYLIATDRIRLDDNTAVIDTQQIESSTTAWVSDRTKGLIIKNIKK